MRLRFAFRLFQVLLFLSSAALLAAALFAVPLGLDNDAGWGRGRLLLAAAGVVLLLSAVLLQAHRRWTPGLKRFVNGFETAGCAGKTGLPGSKLRCTPLAAQPLPFSSSLSTSPAGMSSIGPNPRATTTGWQTPFWPGKSLCWSNPARI
jgi:hypothetical protein